MRKVKRLFIRGAGNDILMGILSGATTATARIKSYQSSASATTADGGAGDDVLDGGLGDDVCSVAPHE